MRRRASSTRTGRLAVLIVGLLALSSGCGESGGREDVADSGPGTDAARIDMVIQPYLSGAVLYIGLVEGYFADEGVDFHLHPAMQGGSHALPALDTGRVDVSTHNNLVSLVNAVHKGARIRIVAGAGYFSTESCDFAGLVARRGLFEEGETVTPESLEGKRIDLAPLSHEGYFVESFLRRGGLTLDDVEHAHLPLAARMEAMDRGAIDMTAISEPWLTRMVEEGHRPILMVNDVVPDLQYSVLIFGSRLLDKERDVGRHFVVGYLRAARQFNEGPTPRNVELVSEFTGLDPETLRRVCWPPIREDGSLERESILEFQRWALEKGHIDRVLEIEELWDPYYTADLGGEAVTTGSR